MNPDNQQQQTHVSSPMNPTPVGGGEPKKTGLVVITLVVILILILGALYLFASKSDSPSVPGDDYDAVPLRNDEQAVQPITNDADDISSIEADLDASVEGLDEQNF